MHTPPRVKICCISSLEEALLALQHGASALGLVSAMPSGPGVIEEATIGKIVAKLPPDSDSFLLTALSRADDIAAQHGRCRTATIQLVDSLESHELQRLRSLLPRVKLVQVIHVVGEESITDAVHVAPWVDEILLDSGNPFFAVKQLGGTGRVHDWSISRRICELVTRPVYLAGGLNAENVEAAINQVRPYGLDVCSGIRTDGRLDVFKLQSFMEAVQRSSQSAMTE